MAKARDYLRAKKRERRALMLKIRVIPKRRMRKADVIAKLLHVANGGDVPDDIEIRGIDWERGHTFGTAPDDIQALRDLVDLIRQSDVRVERAS